MQEIDIKKAGLYPNLTAEYEVGSVQLRVLADWAGVTIELMQEILYGNEDLKAHEGLNLLVLLNQYGKPCSFEYLFSHDLATIDPNTNKSKARIRYLKNLLLRANAKAGNLEKVDILYKRSMERAEKTLLLTERGQVITYALYRQAVGNLEHFLVREKKIRGLSDESA